MPPLLCAEEHAQATYSFWCVDAPVYPTRNVADTKLTCAAADTGLRYPFFIYLWYRHRGCVHTQYAA